ncbi:hypothetical protein CJ030_MR4G003064 [Morella rubra]|uniref:Uncharacterized protein n=1 Tax=Morella rubra TaxID=262757 RepID=A0A6A1VXM3_9ROSI|nr:hypothetical protein CJ030_MR4G003064 [Morella rubra]
MAARIYSSAYVITREKGEVDLLEKKEKWAADWEEMATEYKAVGRRRRRLEKEESEGLRSEKERDFANLSGWVNSVEARPNIGRAPVFWAHPRPSPSLARHYSVGLGSGRMHSEQPYFAGRLVDDVESSIREDAPPDEPARRAGIAGAPIRGFDSEITE